MILSVSPVTPDLRPAVLALRVHPDQVRFAGAMPDLLIRTEGDPHSEAMCIRTPDSVVGFYRLDFAEGAVGERRFPEPSVGLRSYFIDREHQGLGLGTSAMQAVIADLRRRHPDRRLLALSVNLRNPAAIRSYQKAGFAIHGDPYLGGTAGPQHVMVRRLAPALTAVETMTSSPAEG